MTIEEDVLYVSTKINSGMIKSLGDEIDYLQTHWLYKWTTLRKQLRLIRKVDERILLQTSLIKVCFMQRG